MREQDDEIRGGAVLRTSMLELMGTVRMMLFFVLLLLGRQLTLLDHIPVPVLDRSPFSEAKLFWKPRLLPSSLVEHWSSKGPKLHPRRAVAIGVLVPNTCTVARKVSPLEAGNFIAIACICMHVHYFRLCHNIISQKINEYSQGQFCWIETHRSISSVTNNAFLSFDVSKSPFDREGCRSGGNNNRPRQCEAVVSPKAIASPHPFLLCSFSWRPTLSVEPNRQWSIFEGSVSSWIATSPRARSTSACGQWYFLIPVIQISIKPAWELHACALMHIGQEKRKRRLGQIWFHSAIQKFRYHGINERRTSHHQTTHKLSSGFPPITE